LFVKFLQVKKKRTTLSLADAIPRDDFSSRFALVEERITARNVKEFLKEYPVPASTTALYVWDEMVHRRRVVNPSETAAYHPGPPDRLLNFVSRRLGGQPFGEVFCADYFNEFSAAAGDIPFATFKLVHCYPSDIHIVDVELLDLQRPVADDGSNAPRSHAGLGLFPAFLDGLLRVARDRGAKRISLVAASPGSAEVFRRYNFTPSAAPASAFAAEYVGFSFAMVLLVAEQP
jgi:hypothetical protein